MIVFTWHESSFHNDHTETKTVLSRYTSYILRPVRSGGRAVERRTVNRGDGGSILTAAVSKLRQLRSPHICLRLSEETLKAGGPFYLVSMPREINDPTWG